MKIAFYGGETAGCIALLTLAAKKYSIIKVYPEDEKVKMIAKLLEIPLGDKNLINSPEEIDQLHISVDLLICCHARKILKKNLVDKISSINLHPCLYKYKGGYPIQRLLADKNSKASVACHWMIEKVDEGETIVEEFKMIKNIDKKTEAEVYNDLYPLYSIALIKSIKIISDPKYDRSG